MLRSLLDIHGIHIDVHSVLHFFNPPTPDTHIASALELGFQIAGVVTIPIGDVS